MRCDALRACVASKRTKETSDSTSFRAIPNRGAIIISGWGGRKFANEKLLEPLLKRTRCIATGISRCIPTKWVNTWRLVQGNQYNHHVHSFSRFELSLTMCELPEQSNCGTSFNFPRKTRACNVPTIVEHGDRPIVRQNLDGFDADFTGHACGSKESASLFFPLISQVSIRFVHSILHGFIQETSLFFFLSRRDEVSISRFTLDRTFSRPDQMGISEYRSETSSLRDILATKWKKRCAVIHA